MINYIINATNAKKDDWHPLVGSLKSFQIHTSFAMETLIIFFCY